MSEQNEQVVRESCERVLNGRDLDAVGETFRLADAKFVGYWCLTNVAGLMRQITEETAAAPA